jgi:hypothetical protein
LEIADVCCGSKLRRTQYEHMFSPLPLNTDAARVSLTVHSGLDFIDPGQGSVTPWAHTAPGRDTDMAAQQTVVTVVDDNASFLKAVARLLAHNGIESRTFASAEALIESGSAQTASYNAILTPLLAPKANSMVRLTRLTLDPFL